MLAWRVLQASPAEARVDQTLLRALADLLARAARRGRRGRSARAAEPQDTEFVVRLAAPRC